MATVFFNPILILFSIALGILGGLYIGEWTGVISHSDFMYGLMVEFEPFYVVYAMVKTVVFAFLISSISSFYGYNVKGGAVDVGKASTSAVVTSSIALIVANYFLTDFMLS